MYIIYIDILKCTMVQARALAAAQRVQEEYDAYKANITRHLSELSERNGENQRFMSARLAAEQVHMFQHLSKVNSGSQSVPGF